MPIVSNSKKETKNKNLDLVWKAFIKGKKWAFTKIYEDNYDDLYNYGMKFISDQDTTKDLIHDLFLKFWRHRKQISQPNNLKAYLLRGVRSIILDYIKVYKNKFLDTDLNNNITFTTLSSEEIYIEKQSTIVKEKRLYEELEKLPDRQKEAIYLHYIKEYSYQEVSLIMDLKIQSVRNHVHEGLAKLKEKKANFL